MPFCRQNGENSMKEYKVGIIGFGTVGAGVAENLLQNKEVIAKRTGVTPVLTGIADLDITTDRGVTIPEGILTTDAKKVINESDIVVYPEDSAKGYLSELEGFHEGFVLFAEVCYNRGIDIPIFVSYFRKSDKTYIFDAPVMYSELAKKLSGRAEIARYLCNRCNELGKMQFDENGNVTNCELDSRSEALNIG